MNRRYPGWRRGYKSVAAKLCSKCDEQGHRFQGERWLCVRHYRLGQMIYQAQRRGKYAPTPDELAALVREAEAAGMVCPHCKRQMNWAAKPRGYSTVVSLQHDRSGKLRLLCLGCNSRHQSFPGDTMYDYPPDWQFCPECQKAKPGDQFFRSQRTGRRISYCKPCQSKKNAAKWARARATR